MNVILKYNIDIFKYSALEFAGMLVFYKKIRKAASSLNSIVLMLFLSLILSFVTNTAYAEKIPCQLSNEGLKNVSEPFYIYCWNPEEKKEQVDTDAADIVSLTQTKIDNEKKFRQKLEEITGEAFSTEREFVDAVTALDSDLWKFLTDNQKNEIVDLSRIPIELNKLELVANGCDCSRDLSSLVYGFYPYWQANGAPQTVDFSLFDRISFFALSMDNEGYIRETLQWNENGDAASFIRMLHKYRVEADLTINADQWQLWSNSVIENAAESVADIVSRKYYLEKGKLTSLIPFWKGGKPVSVDGVTIKFSHYSKSSESKKLISIVKNIKRKIDAKNLNIKLNIILGLDIKKSSKKNIERLFKNLKNILIDRINGKPLVDYIFTFLQKPTTDTKKDLREIVENSFHGDNRKVVLEKITPILSTNFTSKIESLQFTDDLIYFQYNFSGIGLWPLPLESDKSMVVVKKNIVSLYQVNQGSNYLGKFIDSYFPNVCAYVCPNRWWFRIGFDILVGILLIIAVSAIWSCRTREKIKKYLLFYIATIIATVLIFLLSLICDPFWKDRVDSVILAFFLVIFVSIIWRYVSKAMQPPLP